MGSKKAYFAALASKIQDAAANETEVPLFVDTFPNAGTSDISLSNVNWKVAISGGVTSTTSNYVSSAEGKGANIPLNAGYPEGTNTTKGVLYRGSANPTFFFTEKAGASIDRALYNKIKFSVYVGHSGAKYNNFAVRIGTQWYLTSLAYQQVTPIATGADFAASAELYSVIIDLDVAQWYLLNYVEGVSYAEDYSGTVLLPAGNINGLGLRTGEASGTSRIDSYSVTAIV